MKRQKFAFAAADIFGGGSFNIINFLYPTFLALTVGLSPFWIGFIMLFARVWDAFTDPIMGHISDNTTSKYGKRRVYLIFMSPFIIVSMYLMFFPFQFSNELFRVIAVLFSYMIFTTVQTMVMIPYYALSSEISSDYQERASYNSYRLGFSIFASILCVAVPELIVKAFDPIIGYQVMSLSFGLLFAIAVFVTGKYSKPEIIKASIQSDLNLKDMIKPLKLKPFRQYLYMFLVLQMAMAIMSGLFFFYVNFYITKTQTGNGEDTIVGLVAAALMFSMQIVALPIYLKLIAKKGKTFAYRLGAFIWIVTALSLLIIPADVDPLVIYLVGALMGFGISGPGLVPHTMYGDVIDAGELLFNSRLDGKMSGFTNFINKIAQALGLSFVMFAIGLAGFEEQVLGEPKLTAQPDSAMLAIRLIMALAPLLLMSIGVIISYFYKIDENKQKEIKAALMDETLKSSVLESLQ